MIAKIESKAKGRSRSRPETHKAPAPSGSEKPRTGPRKGPALMVLGMHRSGTSATTRICNLLGVELGSSLMVPQPDNEEGYWEHQEVYLAHEDLLAGIGSAWDDYRALPEDWLNSSAVAKCRKRITSILTEEFADSGFWGVKDPRTCRLVPLWLPVLEQLGRSPRFLLVCRNPLEVAGSLASRNSFPAAKSQLLWLRHLIDAERDTRGHPRTFVTYEDLLRDWRRTMSRAAGALGITWPQAASKAGPKIDRFLKAQLRHQAVDDVLVESDRRLSRWIRDSYRAFKEAAEGDEDQLRRVLTATASELEAAAPLLEPWVRGLELDLAKAGGEIDRQSREASTRLSETERLRGDLEVATTNLADRQKDIAWLNDEVAGRQSEIERLSGELSETKANLADRQKDIAWLNDEVTGRQSEIERLGGELSETKTNLADRQKDIGWLNDEVAGRQSEIERLSGELSEIKANLADRQKDIAWLNNEVSARQGAIDQLSSQLKDAGARAAEQDKEIGRLGSKLSAREAEIEPLRNELEAARTKIVERDLRIAALADDLAEVRAVSEEREVEIELLRGELEAARTAITGRDLQIAALSDDLSEVRAVSDEREAAMFDLQEKLEAQRQYREKLLREHEAVLLSTSWRMTAPIRALRRLWGRIPRAVAARGNVARWWRSRRHARVLAESRLFDAGFYLASNPDVAQAGVDPLTHYLAFGAQESRDPHPLFDTSYYLEQGPDVAETGIDPLTHYLEHGAAEGRNPNPLFDSSWYLEQNPDVAEKGMNPLAHYIEQGWSEGRRPNPLFDPKQYLSLHKDVREAGAEPLSHFVEYGAFEGRTGWTQDDVLRVQSQFIEQPEEAERIAGLEALGDLDLRLEPGARVGVFTSSEGNYFFDEIRDVILEGLREAGLQALPLREDSPWEEGLDARIVIAPHEFFVLGQGPGLLSTELPEKSIILNTEQWGTQWFVRSLPALVRAKAVLDMNLQSAASLASQGMRAAFLPLGYVEDDSTLGSQAILPDLQALRSLPEDVRRFQPDAEDRFEDRPIDICFVGSLGPRRDRILAELAPSLTKFESFLFLPSPERPFVQGRNAKLNTAAVCGLSQRSKVLLNLHQSEASYFEWQRIVFHGFWQQTLVLSEPCYRVPGIEPGEHYIEAEVEDMPAVLDQLLHSAEGRERAETVRRNGRAVLRERFVLSRLFKKLFRLD